MERVRVTIAVLFPAIFLLVSAGAIADSPATGAGSECFAAFFRSCDTKNPNAHRETPYLDQSPRASVRRAVKHFGPHGLPQLLISGDPSLNAGIAEVRAITPEGSLTLARRWQFSLRAAREPRAPSISS